MRSTKVREKRPVGSAIGKAEEDLSWQCTFFPDVNEKRPSVACVIDKYYFTIKYLFCHYTVFKYCDVVLEEFVPGNRFISRGSWTGAAEYEH